MKEEQMAADPEKATTSKAKVPPVDDRTKVPAGHQVVVVSMKPDEAMLVTDAEHTDLEAMGLLIESTKEGARLRGQKEN